MVAIRIYCGTDRAYVAPASTVLTQSVVAEGECRELQIDEGGRGGERRDYCK